MKYLLTLLILVSVAFSAQAQTKKETRQERLEREWKEEFPNIIEETQLPTGSYTITHLINGHEWVTFDYDTGEKESFHVSYCGACNKPQPVNLYRPYRIPALPPYLGLRK